MLLKVVEDGEATPFEIDTARWANGERWVEIWSERRRLMELKSVDEAVDKIEAMLTLRNSEGVEK